MVVTKHRYSAFWGTDIDLVLRSNGIKSLVLAGVVTEGCVESTARDGFFRDYYVVVLSDASAGTSKARHDAALTHLGRGFGLVMDTEAVLGAWRPLGPGARGWQPAVKAAQLLRTLPERLEPGHTALVLIDVQNDFCHPDGVMASKRGLTLGAAQNVVPRILALLDAARRAGAMVIHVRADYGPATRHVGSPFRYPADNRDGAPRPPPPPT